MRAFHRHPVRRRRAFTLIEMVVVTMIILIMAGLILPNMVAITQSREMRSELAALQRMPTEARNEAAKARQVVDLKMDGDYLVMEKTDPQTQETTEIKRLQIGSQFLAETAQLQVVGVPTVLMQNNSGSTDVASWKWSAYPDGTADSGGITFEVGPKRTQQSLYIPADGEARWVTGPLPQPTEQAWTAGDLEQRSSTSTSTTPGAGAAGARPAGGG